MKSYRHDGSLEGFLTCLRTAWQAGERDAGIPATGAAESDWFSTPVPVRSNAATARAWLEDLGERFTPEAARRLVYLYYSESPRAGALALAYLGLLQQHGPEAQQHLTHPAMREILLLTRKVGGEIHSMKGLLRFAEQDGRLVAAMETDFRVLLPVALYFRRRLGGQPWVIFDLRRRRAADWDTRRLSLSDLASDESPAGGRADEMARLWQTFYRAVAIPDRANPKLRRQHMPERYWKYLTELAR